MTFGLASSLGKGDRNNLVFRSGRCGRKHWCWDMPSYVSSIHLPSPHPRNSEIPSLLWRRFATGLCPSFFLFSLSRSPQEIKDVLSPQERAAGTTGRCPAGGLVPRRPRCRPSGRPRLRGRDGRAVPCPRARQSEGSHWCCPGLSPSSSGRAGGLGTGCPVSCLGCRGSGPPRGPAPAFAPATLCRGSR